MSDKLDGLAGAIRNGFAWNAVAYFDSEPDKPINRWQCSHDHYTAQQAEICADVAINQQRSGITVTGKPPKGVRGYTMKRGEPDAR